MFDEAYRVAVGQSGEAFVAWSGRGNDTFSGFVSKFDANGALAWTRQLGPAFRVRILEVAPAPTGQLYVIGSTEGAFDGEPTLGSADAFLAALSSSGALLWVRHFGGPGYDDARSVSVDAQANAYILYNVHGSVPIYKITKVDPAGVVGLTSQLPATTYGDVIRVDGLGNILVAGRTEHSLAGQVNAGGRDAFLQKLDSNRSTVWTRQFGTADDDIVWNVDLNRMDGSVVAVGAVSSRSGMLSGFVRRFDSTGALLWTRPLPESVGGVSIDGSGAIVTCGDLVVRKFDATGSLVWTRQVTSLPKGNAYSVAADSARDLFIAGSVDGNLPGQTSSGDGDAFLMKLRP